MDYAGQHLLRQIVQVVQVVLQALLNIIVQLETGNVDAEQQLHLLAVVVQALTRIAHLLDLMLEIIVVHVHQSIVA